MVERVVVLGATGSIGASTLDVIRRNPERFRVVGLVAGRNAAKLQQLAQEFAPQWIALADEAEVTWPANTPPRLDAHELCAAVQDSGVDRVVAAIAGSAGLRVTLSAAAAGKTLLLANKESLVMAGALFMQAVRDSGATLLPIDSEHNALFQCLTCDAFARPVLDGVRSLTLTASGGPFRQWSAERIASANTDAALAHPNWSMGPKVSVDSASLMNKALELVEAHFLFSMPADALRVVVHPQSIVHSLVDYADGSSLAQLGYPDMRTPIAHALAWPNGRVDSGVARLDLASVGSLTFEPPDNQRFPALDLAFQAMRDGGARMLQLNAANEVACAHFLAGHGTFGLISNTITATLDALPNQVVDSFDAIFLADHTARAYAQAWLARQGGI